LKFLGWVIYDPQKWRAEQVVEAIISVNNMKFKASLVSTKDVFYEPEGANEIFRAKNDSIVGPILLHGSDHAKDKKNHLKKCVLSVGKMASSTCAASIEKSISQLQGDLKKYIS
jgi:hypothetical protein